MQVFNASGSHWVVPSNIGCEAGTVRLNASKCKNKIEPEDATNQIIANLLKTEEALMSVGYTYEHPAATGRKWLVFCYCICIIHAVFTVSDSMHHNQKMPQHLLKCIDRQELTPFPPRKVNTHYHSLLLHFYPVMIICKCHGIESEIQIMCDHCQMWYHIKWIDVPKDSPFLGNSCIHHIDCLHLFPLTIVYSWLYNNTLCFKAQFM